MTRPPADPLRTTAATPGRGPDDLAMPTRGWRGRTPPSADMLFARNAAAPRGSAPFVPTSGQLSQAFHDAGSPGRIDVLFCANPGYFQHLAAAAVSLANASRHPRLVIHVLTTEVDPDREAMLRQALRAHTNVEMALHYLADIPIERRRKLPPTEREMHLRLLAGDVLGQDISRIVYLDCDLIVLEPIEHLYNCDLAGNILAAVPDFGGFSGPESRFRGLGLPPGHVYVNSGVLVIDLRLWRSQAISDQVFRYLSDRNHEPLHKDQDAINAVLQGRITLMDWRWNLQSIWFTPWARRHHPEAYDAAADARRRPGILHFTGPDKPWKFRAGTPNRSAYFRSLAKTPWKDATPVSGRLSGLEYRLSARLLRIGFDLNIVLKVARKIRKAATGLMRPAARHEPATDTIQRRCDR